VSEALGRIDEGRAFPPAEGHEVCGLPRPELTVKMLRAWARVIAYNVDRATHDELTHALAHFDVVHDEIGKALGSVDVTCVEMIDRELAFRRDGGPAPRRGSEW
jgi:hypothetical protein